MLTREFCVDCRKEFDRGGFFSKICYCDATEHWHCGCVPVEDRNIGVEITIRLECSTIATSEAHLRAQAEWLAQEEQHALRHFPSRNMGGAVSVTARPVDVEHRELAKIGLCTVVREGRAYGPFNGGERAAEWVRAQAWYREGVSAYDILPLQFPEEG